MCGIAGFVETSSLEDRSAAGPEARLKRMLRGLEHRGPDDWGMAFFGFRRESSVEDERVRWLPTHKGRVALGHRRLSILDLSPAGRQPMTSSDGSATITFNGEIYNYVELREELAPQVKYVTQTDTEVLLQAYRRWGVEMLPRLDGMYSFALWDAAAGRLLCARDPLAIKPFYYVWENGLFMFASEPCAVLAGLGRAGRVDNCRLAEFIILGLSDHDEGTCFQEVKQLRGGCWLEVSPTRGPGEPQSFWWPPAPNSGVEAGTVATEVRAEIDAAIRRQLRADVPVGTCLSGGLDSGSIVTTVGELLDGSASRFTALTLFNEGFEGDEARMAALSAQRAGVRWLKVETSFDRLAGDLQRMVQAMGEPFTTLSMFGQYKVMEKAREQSLKVMLDGQGGDEVFLGYPRVALRVLKEYLGHGDLRGMLREWVGFNRNAARPLHQTLLANLYFGTSKLVRWRMGHRLRSVVNRSLFDHVREEVAADFFSNKPVHELQVGELTRYVLPRLLRYEDRNSMAFSVEARVPLLAVPLVDRVLPLPLEWKVRNGWTKYALRMAMSDRLPAEVCWHRRKRGFEVPQRRWVEVVRPQLKKWLLDLPADCPINGHALLALVDAGMGDEHWLWRCISVALWVRFCGVRI
jgi:asparagine synthase (glutamine-hydrolysing)